MKTDFRLAFSSNDHLYSIVVNLLLKLIGVRKRVDLITLQARERTSTFDHQLHNLSTSFSSSLNHFAVLSRREPRQELHTIMPEHEKPFPLTRRRCAFQLSIQFVDFSTCVDFVRTFLPGAVDCLIESRHTGVIRHRVHRAHDYINYYYFMQLSAS